MQGVQFGTHLLAQAGDERRRGERLSQAGIMLGGADLEIVRKIVVRVAPPAGAGDPDLLAAQVLAQRLEGDHLVDHANDALAAVLVGAAEALVR
jgi:hypothetical protein